MAQTLDELLIKVLFDNKELQASAKKMEDTVGNFAKNVETTLKSAFGAFTGGFVLNFAKNLAESFVEVNSKLGFLSQTLHTNAKGLALWEEAYKRVGGTAEGFSTTISGIFDKLNQAQLNQDPKTLGILNILGVSPMQDGKRKDILKVYEQTVNALHKLPYGTRRSLAQQLGFDDAGIRLIDKTNEELQASFAHYEKLGVSNQKRTQEAIELRNKWLDVQQEWGNIGQDLVSSFMPQLEQLSKWAMDFVDYLQEHKKEVKLFFEGMIVASAILIASNPFTAWTAGLTAFIALLPKLTGWLKQFPTINKFLENIGNTLSGSWNLSDLGNINGQLGGGLAKSLGISGGITPEAKKFFTGNSVTDAQLLKESSGNPNAIGGQREKEPTYGLYQIRASTASEVLGRPVSGKELLDPAFNKRVRDLYYQKGLQLSGGDIAGALSFYNGGKGGLQHYQKTGQSYNNYAESILSNARALQNQKPQQTSANIHVGNINLPSVTNAPEFTNKMIDMTKTGYVFSSGILA